MKGGKDGEMMDLSLVDPEILRQIEESWVAESYDAAR